MDVYGLILVLFFTGLFGVVIVIGVKIMVELQNINRNLRNLAPRPASNGSSSAQHRREP